MAEMMKELSPEEKWQRATLADSFIFYKVMRHHPDACKELIELLLGIEVESVTMTGEETIIVAPESKSIRLDVYVKTRDRNFDLEMQVVNTGELPQRSRYYQGLMDLDSLRKGEFYSDLKESHVIFICMEDVFEKKLPVESVCQISRYTVFLSSIGFNFLLLCFFSQPASLRAYLPKHKFLCELCALYSIAARRFIKNTYRVFFRLLRHSLSVSGFSFHCRNR